MKNNIHNQNRENNILDQSVEDGSNVNQRSSLDLCNTENNTTMVNKKNINNLFNKKWYYYVISFAQICILTYTIVILYFCFKGEFIFFTWHPLLMTIGWFMLMTQGILIVSRQDYLTRNFSHKRRVQCHWILQAVGAALTTAAFSVIVINKINLNKQHFKTWHALLGLIAFIFCIIGCLTGAAALYSMRLTKYISPRINKFIHISCGVITFIFGGITLSLSVYTKWYGRKSGDNEAVFVIGLLIVISAVVLSSFKSLVNLSKRGYQLINY